MTIPMTDDDILSRYPTLRGNPRAMVMMTAYLHDREMHDDAMGLAMAAIAAAPGDMAIRDEVRTILSSGIPRFHVPMLHDHARNSAYVRAIERAVRPGMRVLEIGTGAGLLALTAARAGAEVTTCEARPVIAAAASAIVRANGFADRVRVVAKQSDAVTIPEDLAEPADLVIHEIFGQMLFNEGVTGAMTDARERLLKPGAKAVPPRAEIRCALARAERPTRVDDIATVEGFDLSLFNLLTRPSKRSIVAGAKSIIACSSPGSALAMDYEAPAPFGVAEQVIELVSTGGRVDGVVQWLRIDFDDETLENDPFGEGERSSWVAPLFTFPTPIETEPGQAIAIKVLHRGTLLIVSLADRAGA